MRHEKGGEENKWTETGKQASRKEEEGVGRRGDTKHEKTSDIWGTKEDRRPHATGRNNIGVKRMRRKKIQGGVATRGGENSRYPLVQSCSHGSWDFPVGFAHTGSRKSPQGTPVYFFPFMGE